MSAAENPSAFPMVVPVDFQFANNGMTLRDWFAGQALPLSWQVNREHVNKHGNASGFTKAVARDAYELADAMLAARGAA